MTVEIVDPSQAVIVTDSALAHFADQSGKASGAAIYLKLKESGCTGYMYVLELVEQQPQDSTLQTLSNGVSLYLDQTSLAMMRGTTIDYVRNGLNSELQFNNPNAKEYCGCGESFSINSEAS